MDNCFANRQISLQRMTKCDKTPALKLQNIERKHRSPVVSNTANDNQLSVMGCGGVSTSNLDSVLFYSPVGVELEHREEEAG